MQNREIKDTLIDDENFCAGFDSTNDLFNQHCAKLVPQLATRGTKQHSPAGPASLLGLNRNKVFDAASD